MSMAIKRIVLAILLMTINYNLYASNLLNSEARKWLHSKLVFAANRITRNISPEDGLPGAVLASRTRANPNYYFHWVRDAGISINALIDVYQSNPSNELKKLIRQKIDEAVYFSSHIQNESTLTGLGEPKFLVTGIPYSGAWGRPQNDGPALRAISFIRWANILITEGYPGKAKLLYSGNYPATSLIKKDLEYVSHHWQDASYDLWEEVKGEHFYTLMVIRRALLSGAKLADRLNDSGAANWYRAQCKLIEKEILSFWDNEKKYFIATKNRVAGLDYKSSNLDISIILGLLHGNMRDGFLAWSDPRVLSTIDAIQKAFANLYPINKRQDIPGIAIGRYPEDKYAGTNFNGGNPWPLCTLAIAEALYGYSKDLYKAGNKQLATKVGTQADQLVERVRFHQHQDGTLDEQIDRYSGYMTSAKDLTWNYAALISANTAARHLK